MSQSQKRISLLISRTIITLFLFIDIVLFLNRDSNIAKALTGISFLLFAGLLLITFKTNGKETDS